MSTKSADTDTTFGYTTRTEPENNEIDDHQSLGQNAQEQLIKTQVDLDLPPINTKHVVKHFDFGHDFRSCRGLGFHSTTCVKVIACFELACLITGLFTSILKLILIPGYTEVSMGASMVDYVVAIIIIAMLYDGVNKKKAGFRIPYRVLKGLSIVILLRRIAYIICVISKYYGLGYNVAIIIAAMAALLFFKVWMMPELED